VDQGLSPARQAAVVAGLEAAVLVIFAASLGIASFNTRGTNTGASPLAEVIIYLLFALCMGLIARGLWRRSRLARTPMVLAQVFGLISAWLFLEGDGAAVAAGVAIVVVSVLGIYLTLRPATGADLLD
jgi:energy-coupling factor transporter transmembrane protein EcfT